MRLRACCVVHAARDAHGRAEDVPYLDDLDRRARRQARAAATEIGLGLLLGLYSCRDEDDAERVLTPCGHARLRRPPRHAGDAQDGAARARAA